MKFRIKHVEQEGYYPQVRRRFRWLRIGRHAHGFGLYDGENYWPHSTQEEAQEVIDEYVLYSRQKTVAYLAYQEKE